MLMRNLFCKVLLGLVFGGLGVNASAQTDYIKELQTKAIEQNKATWGYWGPSSESYSNWTTHSNRLVPVYTFGIGLDSVCGEKSIYRDIERLKKLYGHEPTETVNPHAVYFDQTDIYQLQKQALAAGKKKIILMVFDGMDWQSTNNAAIARSGKIYTEGKGSGLSFLDYAQPGLVSDYGYMVTSPANDGTNVNVDDQKVTKQGDTKGGYAWQVAGEFPWSVAKELKYLIAAGTPKHAYTDSSSSASSMTAGIKTYNDGVNVDPFGREVITIGRELQEKGFAIGAVTSVPISHATPACAYAVNVHRDDYQDLTNDMLGVPSVSHPGGLPGLDVAIGCGWGEIKEKDGAQGKNFVPGNRYLTDATLKTIDHKNGGKYVVAQRSPSVAGKDVLKTAAAQAAAEKKNLFGFFGVKGGHLPFQTADGKYDPTVSAGTLKGTPDNEVYTENDVKENPTLQEMTEAALDVLNAKSDQWWLMVEAGDVDWANHANNLDNSIGAVYSGEAAFNAVTQYLEKHKMWDEAIIIVTADHGHYFNLVDPKVLVKPISN
jgi:alkaline phosphatase